MAIVREFQRIINSSSWLIRLRWLAVSGVVLVVVLSWLLQLKVFYPGIHGVSVLLIIHNITSRVILQKGIVKKRRKITAVAQRFFLYQIITDLILLTFFIYFSGGIENPVILFYVFHIVLASILLKRSVSYLVATFVIFMIVALGLAEYFGLVPHYSLSIIDYSSFNLTVKLAVMLIFSITIYVLVYLVANISEKLRSQEKELIELNDNLERLNADLERKDAVKDEYVHRVTHDIKGHLSAIQTSLSVLVKGIAGPMNEKQEKFAGISYNRTIKLTEFVKELLRLTHLKMNKGVEFQFFDVNAIVDKVVSQAGINAQNKSIELKSDMEPDLKAYGDSFSIEEVISNLTFNAIKYTPENGSVTIKGRQKEGFIQVCIVDTGMGIPEEEIANVFDDFLRASNAKKSK
ncbi:MAG: hypothetical protein C0594_00725, partial [Marinilabiliales bacterium]